MRLEIPLPNGFDSPGIASLHIGGAAIGDERDACICILWRLAPAATHTSLVYLEACPPLATMQVSYLTSGTTLGTHVLAQKGNTHTCMPNTLNGGHPGWKGHHPASLLLSTNPTSA